MKNPQSKQMAPLIYLVSAEPFQFLLKMKLYNLVHVKTRFVYGILGLQEI